MSFPYICYTYYEPILSIEESREYSQQALIDICQKSWSKNNWTLKVLNEKDAQKHKFYQEYKDIIIRLPSVNGQHYDYHCFMRWLAMAQVGGGIMIDYDVINMGVNTMDFFAYPGLTVYQRHVPSVVSGTQEDYANMAMQFCAVRDDPSCFQSINDTSHTSDMLMLASGKTSFNSLNIVVDYPKHGILVHCSHGSCDKVSKSKIESMKSLV